MARQASSSPECSMHFFFFLHQRCKKSLKNSTHKRNTVLHTDWTICKLMQQNVTITKTIKLFMKMLLDLIDLEYVEYWHLLKLGRICKFVLHLLNLN